MITIITGVPGMGKTALVVSMMLKEIEKGERPFFVMGIPDLQLDHSPVPPVSEWTELRPDKDDPSVMLPYYTFPPNSIVIIDEAQRVFRPRASTSKVPDHVAAQETHRHTGVDFWLLTQKPRLMDPHIRDLCGRHIHIRNDVFFGRKLYEWPEFADVSSKSERDSAIKRNFKPPKISFNKYKSSELHTKQTRRFHQIWLILAVVLGFTAYHGYNVYETFQRRMADVKAADQPIAAKEQKPQLANPLKLADYQPGAHEKPVPAPPAAPAVIPHPFLGYAFVIKAVIEARGQRTAYYELTASDGRLTFIKSTELEELGYSIRMANDCSAFLFFNGAQVVASCQRDGNQSAQQRGTVADALQATNLQRPI